MTVKIFVKNTYCYISRDFNLLSKPIQNRLVKKLSYERKVNLHRSEEVYLLTKNTSSNADNSKYYKLPTGLLWKFHRMAKEEGVQLAITDGRGPKPGYRHISEFFNRLNEMGVEIERRDYQEEAIRICLQKRRGLIEHSTGAGKTIVIAGVAYCVNMKTLVICTGKEHIRQITRDLELMVGDVSVYGSGKKDTYGSIIVANVQALNALKKRSTKNFIELMRRFGCVIGDEAHHASSITYKQCFYYAINASIKLGFSGTMHREDGSFIEVEGAIGPIIDKKDYDYLEKGKYIVPARFFFIDPQCSPLRGEDNYWPMCSHAGIVINNKRNQLIARICEKYQNKNKQVLVISPFRVQHGQMLEDIIPDSRFVYGDSSDNVRDEALKDFSEKKFSVLIGSRIYDEVINLPDVRCVILAGGGKAHNSFFQRVGRGIRNAEGKSHVDVVLFWDSHGTILLKHSKRLKYYIGKVDSWKQNLKMLGKIRQSYPG